MKQWLRNHPLSAYALIGIAVQVLWVALEVVIDGEVQPSTADSVIGMILLASLFENFHHWLEV